MTFWQAQKRAIRYVLTAKDDPLLMKALVRRAATVLERFKIHSVKQARRSKMTKAAEDATLDILQSLDWMVTDLDYRRTLTGLDADGLSPEMQKATKLRDELRAGKIQCRRVQKL